MPQRFVGYYYLTSRHHLLYGGIAEEKAVFRSMSLVYLKALNCQYYFSHPTERKTWEVCGRIRSQNPQLRKMSVTLFSASPG
jgi:hypothetical protein